MIKFEKERKSSGTKFSRAEDKLFGFCQINFRKGRKLFTSISSADASEGNDEVQIKQRRVPAHRANLQNLLRRNSFFWPN